MKQYLVLFLNFNLLWICKCWLSEHLEVEPEEPREFRVYESDQTFNHLAVDPEELSGFGVYENDPTFNNLEEDDDEYDGEESIDLDGCLQEALVLMKDQCPNMKEEVLDKIAVHLLNCKAAAQNRDVFLCSEQMNIKNCTEEMDADTLKAYSLIRDHAKSVCYSALSKAEKENITSLPTRPVKYVSRKKRELYYTYNIDDEGFQTKWTCLQFTCYHLKRSKRGKSQDNREEHF